MTAIEIFEDRNIHQNGVLWLEAGQIYIWVKLRGVGSHDFTACSESANTGANICEIDMRYGLSSVYAEF